LQVRCLQKPYGIREPQEFEREEDTIYYKQVYEATDVPKMVQIGRKWLWTKKKDVSFLVVLSFLP